MFTVVDGHVHIYDCFDVPTLLDAAERNLASAARQLGRTSDGEPEVQSCAALVLTESVGYERFGELSESAAGGTGGFGRWHIETVPDDPCALCATRGEATRLFLIAGRQVVTSERIELHAIGTRASFADGEPAEKTLDDIAGHAAVAALPWGAGKWLGARGRLVDRLLATRSDLLLSDNAGRPSFWPRGTRFAPSGRKRRTIISGSDPLRIAGEEGRVGRAGFVLEGPISHTEPARWLAQSLRDRHSVIDVFSPREGPLRFARNQLLIRVNPAT